MLPFRSRRPKKSYKKGVKHSGTLIINEGPSAVPDEFVVLKTSGGPRSTDGAPQTIQSLASTDEDCRTGDTVKLINLHIQAGARPQSTTVDRTGWVEWAFICVRENETSIPITRAGVQTLGDIATNMYRGECIFTGNIPVGNVQPVSQEISLKIPKHKQSIKLGDEWRFITYMRSVNSASVETGSVRTIKSYNYIVKS